MTTPIRTAIIAGNWKMYYGPKKAASFAREIVPELVQLVQHHSHIMCILCPPAISLEAVRNVLDAQPHPHVELGAQNMYYEDQGAFTGEISPTMVHELCSTVILGHSERRTYFGESDEMVNKKAQAALHHGLRPIICIGEHEDQYDEPRHRKPVAQEPRARVRPLAARLQVEPSLERRVDTGRDPGDVDHLADQVMLERNRRLVGRVALGADGLSHTGSADRDSRR